MFPIARRDHGKILSCSTLPYYVTWQRKTMCRIRQRIVQSIARSAANIAICRIFLRSVLLWVIDRQGMVTDRHDKYRPRIDDWK